MEILDNFAMSDRGQKPARTERDLREVAEITRLGVERENLIRLANQDNATAQTALGYIYASQGNDAEAAKWLRRAAEEGNPEAQFSLGELYEEGQLISEDFAQTVESLLEWYGRAAEQGHVDAQFSLGRMYADGEGVAQDYVEAAKWYRRAAEQGDDSAQFNLGRMYADGEGVAQDYVLAHMWLNLSTSRTSGDEHKGDAEMRDAIAVEMTREQVAEAQRLAREWKPKTWEELKK